MPRVGSRVSEKQKFNLFAHGGAPQVRKEAVTTAPIKSCQQQKNGRKKLQSFNRYQKRQPRGFGGRDSIAKAIQE